MALGDPVKGHCATKDTKDRRLQTTALESLKLHQRDGEAAHSQKCFLAGMKT